MHISKLNKFDINFHHSSLPCEQTDCWKLQIHAFGGHSDFIWVYTRLSSIRTVKIKIFNIYQKDLISCGKIEHLKIAVLSLFRQENCL